MLRDLQLRLGGAFHERTAGGPESSTLLAGLRPLANASAVESLEIYQSAVARALEAALQEIFPVCHALVGDDCFRSIARHYDALRASTHADLARVGDELPGLLSTFRFLDDVPYLRDVATLELAVHDGQRDSSIAASDQLVRRIEEAAADPFGWRLVPTPSLELVLSEYPVLSIWHAHQPSAEQAAVEAIDLTGGGERVAVWHDAEGMHLAVLDASLFELLVAIRNGRSLGELLTMGDGKSPRLRDDLVDADPEDYALVLARIGEIMERGFVLDAARVSSPVGSS